MKYVRTLQGTMSHKQEKNKKRLFRNVFCPFSFPFYQTREDRYVISGMEASESTVENTTVSTAYG